VTSDRSYWWERFQKGKTFDCGTVLKEKEKRERREREPDRERVRERW
jgi:hypothetical protein